MDDTKPGYILEPLSERELEILRLIEEGCSNREIAQKLVLSLETVKWYNKQIYSKLGVHNRTQAVACARDGKDALGLTGRLASVASIRERGLFCGPGAH